MVTKTGEVFKVNGDSKFVHPEILGDLKGAYVTHNHTANETEYSFSKEDRNLFLSEKIKLLRGIDDKYIYELSRFHNRTEGDYNPLVENMNFENFLHTDNIH